MTQDYLSMIFLRNDFVKIFGDFKTILRNENTDFSCFIFLNFMPQKYNFQT